MKDIFQIFEKTYQDLQEAIENANFYRSSYISSDLISLSVLSDFPDGIMIGTVLEGIFYQMEDLLEQYQVNEKDTNAIKKEYRKQIDLLSKWYKDEDKSKIYKILRDLTTVTAVTEFKYNRMMKAKDEDKTETDGHLINGATNLQTT
jgi:hypothetical protein